MQAFTTQMALLVVLLALCCMAPSTLGGTVQARVAGAVPKSPVVFADDNNNNGNQTNEVDACQVCGFIVKKAVDWIGCGGGLLSYKECLALLENPLAAAVCLVVVKELKDTLDYACHKYTDITDIEKWAIGKVCNTWCH